MNPLTTSAFDLPDHLAPKADPALIAGDEQHFAAIAESLEQSIADLSDRLDAERKAPGGIGQEAMDRDLEVHRLTARLRTLRRFGLDLCLGHIGRRRRPGAGVRRAARPHRQRGPSAAARLALPRGRAVLRGDPRQPDGPGQPPPVPLDPRPDQRLLGRGVHRRTGSTGHAAALDDQSAFIASLGSSRSARMRDVLGTIQADQDAIIRAGSRGALVVDGGPGTGQDRRRAAPHGVPALLRPAPRPPPGRRAVRRPAASPTWPTSRTSCPASARRACRPARCGTSSPRELRPAIETDPDVARLKSSADLVTAIEPAVRFYEEPPTAGMTVETPWSDVWLSADDWAEAFDAPEPGTPHNEARDQVWDELVTILADKHDDDVPDGSAPQVAAAEPRSCSRPSTARGR